jgi:hypothetical protein
VKATHAVTQVALIRHPARGVLLLHSANRRWHLPDVTLDVDDGWENALQRSVASATGIADFQIDGVLRIDTFAAGVVGDEPHYGIFFACSTHVDDLTLGPEEDAYSWVSAITDFDDLRSDLFHPLIEQLVMDRLSDAGLWPVRLGRTRRSEEG